MLEQESLEQKTFTELLDRFQIASSGEGILDKMRQKAWQQYLQLGLPSRKDEVFRYIKLRQLFSKNYQRTKSSSVSSSDAALWIYPECENAYLVFVNGIYRHDLSNISALPKAVVVCPIHEAVNTYGAFLNNHWSKAIKEETDAFAAINASLHEEGAFIYLSPKAVVEKPIQILHLIDVDDEPQMLLPRLQVFVGANSDVKFIFRQKQLSNAPYFINQVQEFVLEEGCHVDYSQIYDDEHSDAWHFDALRATLKKNSTLHTVAVTQGSASVRTDYRVALIGENAEALLNGLSVLSNKNESHCHILIEHAAPACRSFQLFKGVLTDFSRSSFEGKIFVQSVAQKTEAFQLNNNLLLSDHAQANSKPNLEIFADDVKASHGATVGQLNPEQLFYMKTRGFSDAEAKNLLVYGFCEQVVEKISVDSAKMQCAALTRHLFKGSPK